MKQITAADLANTKIRVTPEQSKQVQELAFSLGFKWFAGAKVQKTDKYSLWFKADYSIGWAKPEVFKSDDSYREITFADLFPEEAEPITPEALEKEGWSELKDYHVGEDHWQEFLNEPIQVSFKNGQFFSAIIRTRHACFDTPIKGVETMPKLRLLTELINGE